MALLCPGGSGTAGLHTPPRCPPTPPPPASSLFLIFWCGFLLVPPSVSPLFGGAGEFLPDVLESHPLGSTYSSLSGSHPTKPKTMVHCAGCKRPILDRFLLNVLDRAWHVKCVQCCECKCNLTEKCFSREGKLYCKNDFFR